VEPFAYATLAQTDAVYLAIPESAAAAADIYGLALATPQQEATAPGVEPVVSASGVWPENGPVGTVAPFAVLTAVWAVRPLAEARDGPEAPCRALQVVLPGVLLGSVAALADVSGEPRQDVGAVPTWAFLCPVWP
jgi:hypothetical protein